VIAMMGKVGEVVGREFGTIVRCMLAAKPSTMPYLEHGKDEQQKGE
jgi:hypothetical protein